MRICSIPMADRVVGPYIQERKLLAGAVCLVGLPAFTEDFGEFVALTGADRDVRPYNVSCKIFCRIQKFLRTLTGDF